MITQIGSAENVSKIFFLFKKFEVTTVDTLTGVYAFVNQKGSKTCIETEQVLTFYRLSEG